MKFTTLSLLLASVFNWAGAEETVAVGGEVDLPRQFDLDDTKTLGELFEKGPEILPLGATNRIKIYRDDVVFTLDLRKHGDRLLKPGDIVEVPQKYLYEGQPTHGPKVASLLVPDPDRFLKALEKIRSEKWTNFRNWRAGLEGREFRPVSKAGETGGVWLFVRPATESEQAKGAEASSEEAGQTGAFVVIGSDLGRSGGEEPSEFEVEALSAIRAAAGN